MLTVYGIKSCDSCRRARNFLESRNIEFRFHDLREDGLDIQMLERWSARFDWERLLNRKSLTWRKIPETDRVGMTKDRALDCLMDEIVQVIGEAQREDGYLHTPVLIEQRQFGVDLGVVGQGVLGKAVEQVD